MNLPLTQPRRRPIRHQTAIGRGLETVIVASQRDVVRLEHLPSHGAKFVRGGKTVRTRVCSDFFGCFIGSGRLIIFDAKSCADPNRFPVGDRDHVHAHQIEALERFGRAGAVAGLVIEQGSGGPIYWLDWREIVSCERCGIASIQWIDSVMCLIGERGNTIDFGKIPR